MAQFDDDRHFVTALARGLEVLACFRSGRRMLGNQELAERCGLPKSTISRLTHTLVKLGYLTQDEDSGKYKLGMATLSLGVGMLAKLDIRQVARPYMQELADFSQAMVSLGVRDRLSMLYIENCRSQSALTLSLDVGARIPIVTSSMGRGYLAVASEAERREIADRLSELDAWSRKEIMDGIDKAVEEYRTLGVTTSFGDWQKDVNAIALGFQFSSTQPIMVITCGAPSFKMSEQFLLDEVRPRLLETVSKIRRAMGHH
nr:IclR family transcriptional regulator [Paracandidimonas lactea]